VRLLHLDSSALGAASVSRKLTAEIVARQRALRPDIQVTYSDLAADPALHLTGAHMAVRAGASNTDASIDADLIKGNTYLDDLLAADIVVIGAPMYNFSIPTPLKSWVDRIAVAGKTFQYTATGPVGLLTGKKAFVASARGSVYAAGTPAAANEHQESYLIGLLSFLGLTNVKVVRAEGLAFGPEAKQASVASALEDIAALTV